MRELENLSYIKIIVYGYTLLLVVVVVLFGTSAIYFGMKERRAAKRREQRNVAAFAEHLASLDAEATAELIESFKE